MSWVDLGIYHIEDLVNYRLGLGKEGYFLMFHDALFWSSALPVQNNASAAVVFQVTVSDGGTSPKQSSVWVVVQVLDENDNKPQFPEKVYQIKLPERDRKKRGEPIYRAFAFDKDEGPNAEISYSIVDGNDDGKFFIDPKTGMVSSRKQFTAGSYDILTVSTFPSVYKPMVWLFLKNRHCYIKSDTWLFNLWPIYKVIDYLNVSLKSHVHI